MTSVDITTITTADALIQAYTAGARDFSEIDLPTAQLNNADLKGIALSYADLSEANLSGAKLRGVDLSYAILREANLSNADLRGAMLIGADLQNARLAGANLQDADYSPDETRFPDNFDPVAAGMQPTESR